MVLAPMPNRTNGGAQRSRAPGTFTKITLRDFLFEIIISLRDNDPVKAITYAAPASAALRKHSAVAQAIIAKIERYAETGARDVKALVGRPGKRLRAGGLRIIFEEDATTIRVLILGPRGGVHD